MKIFLRLFLLLSLAPLHAAPPTAIPPETVAVVYNSRVPESFELAQAYAEARAIPEAHLLGIALPDTASIARADFNRQLRDPLAAEFLRQGWLTRERTAEGTFKVTHSKIKVLVSMRGIPYKISTTETLPRTDAEGKKLARWHIKQDDASVDAELTLLGNTSYAIEGPLENPYFKSTTPFLDAEIDPMILVGRIDGPTWEDCTRMIADAVAVEKTGLWGMHYLDLAKKVEGGYQLGDDWIESIARTNRELGFPTVIDRHRDTFVTNYPMDHAASYFGWYTTNRNGPFLNPDFRFRKGAVAVHLHSFSATDLRNPDTHWTGPLLSKGAAATLGNVWEPFLQLTHHFDLFQQRLLEGFTLAEAAYSALPALSWQSVVIGDPLYRPYAQLDQSPEVSADDASFVFLHDAYQKWADDPETRVRKIRTEAAKTNSGILYEALGLILREDGESDHATAFFDSAAKNYPKPADKIRQELHIIDMVREAGRTQDAINRIRSGIKKHNIVPEGKALAALLTIVDPPAPPPVEPGKE
jgi:uncharacterized protein (TIGR03790 family)